MLDKKLKAKIIELELENKELRKDNQHYKDFIAAKQGEEKLAADKINKQWNDFWNYDGTPQGGLNDGN